GTFPVKLTIHTQSVRLLRPDSYCPFPKELLRLTIHTQSVAIKTLDALLIITWTFQVRFWSG
ncbi:hypothetical protein, partial [Porphyromonas gulae]|uniref:hypothetical protein n=1 Tax=Porphyromonas gulae TaxID=111105 RepID=UPI00242D7CF5